MRVAILSDIHGNLTALEAVLTDVRQTSPDLILHAGDLADTGSSPVAVVDLLRSLGVQGVVGNTDQMLASPETFEEFASRTPHLSSLWTVLRQRAVATRETLEEERLAWLRNLPPVKIDSPIALVHAGSPESTWRAPTAEASDDELRATYGPLGQPMVVYGHIHRAYIRRIPPMTIANTGSVGLPYDGDPRASYLLLDNNTPEIRRVEYDLDQEIKALLNSGFPHSEWVARTLKTALPQMP